MAYTVPIGTVYLLNNIPFDKEYKHVKYFSSASVQNDWICGSSHVIGTSNPKTGQNQIKDPLHGTIRIAGHQENYLGCSYMAWKNTAIDESGDLPSAHTWNYAFVDDVKYVSNAVMEIDYSIDVFQTYLFQGGCTISKAYIKRTHTQTDVVGEHIEPEPLSFSDMKLSNRRKPFWSSTYPNWNILVYQPSVINGTSAPAQGIAGNIMQGLVCNVFKGGYYEASNTAFDDFVQYIRGDNTETGINERISAIVAVVVVPSEFIQTENDGHLQVLASSTPYSKTITNIPVYNDSSTTLDGYTPTNKKLLTYPYNYMLVTDGDKSQQELRYEFFKTNNNNEASFACVLAIQPTPEAFIAPKGYGGLGVGEIDYDRKLSMTDFPQVPVANDAYRQWVGTSKIGTNIGLIAGAVGIGGSLLTGNGLAAIGSGLSFAHSLGSYLDGQNNAKQTSPSVKSGASSAMVSANAKTFYVYQKHLCENDAKRLDDFFSRYGYAINRIQTIRYTNPRFNQHFVQTSECIINGGAPASVKDTIANAMNRGVTFWKNTVGDYDT